MPGKRYTNKEIIEKLEFIIKENEKTKHFSISAMGITLIAISFAAMLYLDMFDNFGVILIAWTYLIFGMIILLFSEQIVKICRKIKKDKVK